MTPPTHTEKNCHSCQVPRKIYPPLPCTYLPSLPIILLNSSQGKEHLDTGSLSDRIIARLDQRSWKLSSDDIRKIQKLMNET